MIHLFEFFESGKYNYRGVAHLIGDPYQEMQKDAGTWKGYDCLPDR